MPPADPTPEPLDDDAINRALAILLDVGTALATELKAPAPETVVDRARAFDVVARAVRQTVLLSRHLAEHRPAAADAARAQARRTVIRGVEDAISQSRKPVAAESLRRELLERMERPDLDHDLLTRGPAHAIAEICRDLGLRTLHGLPAPRRTPADIDLLCARAAAPTSIVPAAIGPDPLPLRRTARRGGPALRLAEN